MTVGDIERRIAKINEVRADHERAHWLERGLWRDVMIAIADGADDPASLARAAMQSEKITFARYMA